MGNDGNLCICSGLVQIHGNIVSDGCIGMLFAI